MSKGINKLMKTFIFLNVTAVVTSVVFEGRNLNVSFLSSLLNIKLYDYYNNYVFLISI